MKFEAFILALCNCDNQQAGPKVAFVAAAMKLSGIFLEASHLAVARSLLEGYRAYWFSTLK